MWFTSFSNGCFSSENTAMDERVQTALLVNRRHGATSAEKAVLGFVLVLSLLMIVVLLGALLWAPNLFQP